MSARATCSSIWQPTSASHFTTGYTSGLATCCGRGRGERGEQPVFVHALSGAASFAACLRLFRSYPLSVNFFYPDEPEIVRTSLEGQDKSGSSSPRYSGGWQRSIILRHRAFEGSGYYVLAQAPSGHFTL